MPVMNDIERQTKVYAEAREKLAGMVAELTAGLEALKRDRLPAIKRALQRAAEKEAELRAVIEGAPELFTKPRTVVMHGVKVGWMKGAGKIDFDDPDQVVALIKKKLPDQADVLVATTEKPVKKALQQLSVKELQSIGCQVEGTDDVVVIKAVDSDVDKLVTALLRGATQEAAD